MRNPHLLSWLVIIASSARSLTLPPGLGDWWSRDLDRTPHHAAAAVFRLFSTVDLWPRLPEIRAPTLLIVGDNCPAIRKQQLADMAKALPRGRLVSLEGYDYGIHFLAPDRCVKAVREFLAGTHLKNTLGAV